MHNFRPFPTRPSRGDDWFMQAPLLTVTLCALCVLVTLASWLGHSTFGAVSTEEVWDGRWWGLLSAVFLHGGILHLLFNMLWLYTLGVMLERTLNTAVYLLFLAAAAAVGSGCELAVSGTTGIGASGVVYAMFGLMWAGRGRFPEWGALATPQNLRLFIGWGVFCAVATHFGWMNIASGAHAGGFLFGLSVGWIFLSARPLRWLWAFPLAGLLALTVLSVTWMPWSGYWCFWKANREYDRGQYARAAAWSTRSAGLGVDPADNWHNAALAWQELAAQDTQRNDQIAARHDAQEAQADALKAGPDAGDTP